MSDRRQYGLIPDPYPPTLASMWIVAMAVIAFWGVVIVGGVWLVGTILGALFQ